MTPVSRLMAGKAYKPYTRTGPGTLVWLFDNRIPHRKCQLRVASKNREAGRGRKKDSKARGIVAGGGPAGIDFEGSDSPVVNCDG